MTPPLLTTKLYTPPLPARLVARSRLLERLDEGLRPGHKLLLLSAPAGFGKTTLLSEWISTLKPDVKSCWLALDEADDDPARFLAYLVAGLQMLEPGIGQGGVEFQQQSLQDALAVLINRFVALSGERAAADSMFILVLDDLHLVTLPPIYDGLTFLLDHMPAQMRLVIATRADPPVPLARLRARGQLTELRQSDLRFALDEAAEFLNHVKGLGLAAESVSALAARTEGWIAGLQMAALALESMLARQHGDPASFIRAFAGSHRYVLDYLVEEVLQRQPPDVQQFLLQTSVLERLCGPLCDAVLASENHPSPVAHSQTLLEYLERANLFVVPLDDRREWYRYHRLFADLLQQRLQQSCPDLALSLQLRASVWCAQNGLMAEAIDYALAAQDFQRAAYLVDQAAQATLMRSEVTTFLRWMQALPDAWVRQYPSLCIYYAWALLMSGYPWAEVTARLQEAAEDSPVVSAQAAALHSFMALFQGHVTRADELSRQALAHLPEDDAFLRGFATFSKAAVCFDRGDAEAGRRALAEVLRPDQKTGNMAMGIMALCYLAESYLRQGQLLKAQSIYQQALALATLPAGQRLPVAGVALMGLGELAREWNDFDAATEYLEEGLELGKRWGKVSLFDGYLSLAFLKQAQGDVAGAQHFVRLAQELAVQFDATQVDDWSVAMSQALLWLRQGDLAAVAQWAQDRQVDGCPEFGPHDDQAYLNGRLRKYEQLVLARWSVAQGQPVEALALLEQSRVQMQQRGRMSRVIEIDALQALAFQAQGWTDDAMASLERALTHARPEGYVRLFADEGEPMRALLRAARQKLGGDLALAAYIDKLLSAFVEIPPQPDALPRPLAQSAALVEPLSERELQVLRLLTGGMSVAEIAAKLFVSVSTVRTHVKNVYAKLDVHSRYEAVARARDLDLL